MKCLKCNNKKDFIVLGNQNLKVGFENNHLREVKKGGFTVSNIYPIICKKCQSEEVEFKYFELKRVLAKIK